MLTQNSDIQKKNMSILYRFISALLQRLRRFVVRPRAEAVVFFQNKPEPIPGRMSDERQLNQG